MGKLNRAPGLSFNLGKLKRAKGAGASAPDQIKVCGNIWLSMDDPNVKAIS
jgi:hypothetical protein